MNQRQAKVVEMRFFTGLSVEETAAALDVSERTAKADWQFARKWLSRALDGDGDGGADGEPEVVVARAVVAEMDHRALSERRPLGTSLATEVLASLDHDRL